MDTPNILGETSLAAVAQSGYKEVAKLFPAGASLDSAPLGSLQAKILRKVYDVVQFKTKASQPGQQHNS